MQKKTLFTLIVALFLSHPTILQAVVTPDSSATAKAFIKDLGARAIESLTKPGLSQTQLENQFQALLEEGFDVAAIGQFVMGSNWQHLNVDQQKRFIPLFEKRLKRTYSNRFQQYRGVKFQVRTARQEGDHVIVHSTIRKPGSPVTPVDWHIKDGKIHDVKIEGVSMAITMRDEYKEQFKKGHEEEFLGSLDAS